MPSHPTFHVLNPRVLGLSGLLCCGMAAGDAFTWEAVPVSNNWSGSANWAGTFGAVPDDATDSATISGANPTDPILDADFTIGSLSILADGDLLTGLSSTLSLVDNHELTVAGTALIDGIGSTLTVRESGSVYDMTADQMTLANSATMTLQGASEVRVNGQMHIDADSSAFGDGAIFLDTGIANTFSNDGTILAAGTLRIAGIAGNAGIFDWDGSGGTARLVVTPDSRMDIDLDQGGDGFDGVIEVGAGGIFDNAFAWQTGTGISDEVILNGGPNPATDAARIDGETATIRGTLTVEPGVAIFGAEAVIDSADVSVAGGAGTGAGRLVFQDNVTLISSVFTQTAAGARIEPNEGFVVSGGLTVINASFFDLDGGAGGPDTSAIQAGSTLDLNVEQIDIADNDYTGTLNIAGTLNVDVLSNNWTNDAGTIFLRGGRLEGDRLSNEGLLHGYGTVSARVRNEDRIAAEGGLLIMSDVDLDGVSEAGNVDALTGDAALVGDHANYGGTMRIGNGGANREIILRDNTQNTAIIFDDNDSGEVSELYLNNGRLWASVQSNTLYDIEFDSMLDSRGNSEIQASAVRFGSTSDNHVLGQLRMDADTAVLGAADFTGNGRIINDAGHTINFADNADLNTVSLQVDGKMRLFGNAAGGEAQVANFRQTSSGSSEFHLSGFNGGANADRLIVDGDARLRGELDLNVNFTPTLYDGFLMIPVAGSIDPIDTHFQTIDGVIYTPGEGMAVTYDSDGVHVTAAYLGDANLDGAVDLLDLDTLGTNWLDGNETWSDGDFNGDGLVNLIDLDLLGGNWGVGASMDGMSFASALAASGMSVPEPGSIVLLALGAAAIGRRRRA